MLIDTHCHIHFKQKFPDLEEVLKRAYDAGIDRMITVGCDWQDSLKAQALAAKHEHIYWTMGIHPHEVEKMNDQQLQKAKELLQAGENLPVAIGEIGLDYYRDLSPRDLQKRRFREQLELAREFDLPVILHVREAYEDMFKLIDESDYKKVLFHCFTAGLREADWIWSKGMITSFPGVVTYPKNDDLREVVSRAPKNLYVVETDCPYLTPQKYRGQRNEPAYVAETAQVIAETRQVSLEQVASETTANAQSFFNLVTAVES